MSYDMSPRRGPPHPPKGGGSGGGFWGAVRVGPPTLGVGKTHLGPLMAPPKGVCAQGAPFGGYTIIT